MFASHSSSSRARVIGAAMRHVRKRLCSRLRELADASDAGFMAGWQMIVAEVEAGFRQEETIMEILGYSGLQPHRAENACTLRALHRITPQVEAGQTALARQALSALADILSLHRLTAGVALANRPPRPALMPGRHGDRFAPRGPRPPDPAPGARQRHHRH
jgi:hypothetical protein